MKLFLYGLLTGWISLGVLWAIFHKRVMTEMERLRMAAHLLRTGVER